MNDENQVIVSGINNPLSKPYTRKIGKTTFRISSFGSALANKTAQEIVVELMQSEFIEDNTRSIDNSIVAAS